MNGEFDFRTPEMYAEILSSKWGKKSEMEKKKDQGIIIYMKWG